MQWSLQTCLVDGNKRIGARNLSERSPSQRSKVDPPKGNSSNESCNEITVVFQTAFAENLVGRFRGELSDLIPRSGH